MDGEYKESIFDMWIKLEDGKEEFLEIKYSSDLENLDKRKDRISKQIKLQQKWCKENNYPHRIVTEKHIRVQPLLSNSKIILPYIKKMKQTSEITKYKILKSLNNETSTTIKSLADQLKEIQTSELFQGIFSLYLSKQVIIDIESTPINQNTEVLLINE